VLGQTNDRAGRLPQLDGDSQTRLTQLQQFGSLAKANILKFFESPFKGRHYKRLAGSVDLGDAGGDFGRFGGLLCIARFDFADQRPRWSMG
jgi:hypothetical protein